MQETLVIEITKGDPAKPSWVCFNAESQIIDEALLGDPGRLAALADERDVIVLLPMSDIALLNVPLPPMNRQRLLQSLPFAIEEHVLQEVSGLHVVPLYAEHEKEGLMPVLVVDHVKMQEWMQSLRSWGVSANMMTATLFAIPYNASAISMFLDDPLLVRLGQYNGFVCDADNIDVMLMPSIKEQEVRSVIVYRDASSNVPVPAIEGVTVQEKTFGSQEWLRIKARFVLSEKPINLLQGRYFSRKMRLPKGLLYQTIAGLAACWVGLMLLYPIVSYAILQVHLSSLDRGIAAIYKKHFPGASRVVSPKLSMEDRMTQLTNAASENKLMLLLGYFGRALADVPSVDIKHLNYTDQEISLEVTASSAQDVSRFVDKLSHQGLQLTQQNANLSGDKASVSLLVRFE